MADSDYNVVKPLESVQTIQGMAPAQQRLQRKRQQSQSEKHEPESEQQEEPQEQAQIMDEAEISSDEDGPHMIDYCA